MGNVSQRTDVAHFSERVARGLSEQQLGVGLHGVTPLLHIGLRHESGLHTELAELVLQQRNGRAKHALRTHHMVARLEQPHQQQQDRAHAAGGGNRRLGAFQRRQATLEHHRRRVGEARVDEGFFLVGKAGRRSGGIRMVEAAGQEQRFGVFAPLCGG